MNLFVLLLVLFFVAAGITGSVIVQNQPLIEQRIEELDQGNAEIPPNLR